MAKEALDAVKDGRPYAGVHILATALLCAAGSTPDELELARRLLERDPRDDAPRETESVAGAFNRHMDAAIDSLNDSVHEPLRVGRRARLAADLGRAGLVIIDRSQVAELIAVVHELRGRVAELEAGESEDLGAELLVEAIAEERDFQRSIDQDASDRYDRDPLALEFLEGAERSAEFNPSVND
jgi:hypothetical protein